MNLEWLKGPPTAPGRYLCVLAKTDDFPRRIRSGTYGAYDSFRTGFIPDYGGLYVDSEIEWHFGPIPDAPGGMHERRTH